MWDEPSYGFRCAACDEYHKKPEDVLKSYRYSDAKACSPEYISLRKALNSKPEKIAKFLLERGAKGPSNVEANENVESHKNKPLTLLQCAVVRSNIKIAQLLLQENADVETRFPNDLTLLHIAAQSGDTEMATVLLDHGADMNSVCASSLGKLLHTAVKEDEEALVELLLRKCTKLHENMKDDGTLLVLAATWRSHKVVKLLLNNGADIDARDKKNKNILYLAMEWEDLPLIEQILEAYSDPRNKRGCFHNAIHGSMVETQNKIVEVLRRYYFGFNSKDAKDCSLLHNAISRGCLKIVEYLFNLGTHYNAESKTRKGVTPLHTAVKYKDKQIEIAKLLIKNKANVNAKERNGKTPLHYAVKCGRILHVSVKRGHAEAVKLLMENGADIADRNNKGETSLHIAAASGCLMIVEIVLNAFEDVNCRNKAGKTALHVATERGNVQIVQLLLDHDSDINLVCNAGKTPFNYACLGTNCNHGRQDDGISDQSFDDYNDHNDHNDHSDHDDYDDHDAYDYSDDYDDHDYNVDYNDYHKRDKVDDRFEEVADMLELHRIKMIAMNRWVSNKNLQAMHIFHDDKCFHVQCKREIECMRQKKIGVSNISYYDVLTKGMNQVTLYARNKDIVDALETGNHNDMFDLYSGMLNCRFKKGQKRAGLLDSSLKCLSFLTGYALPDLLIIELFNYLSNKDLENLIKAGLCNESDR